MNSFYSIKIVLDEKDYVDHIISVFNNYDKIQPVIQENCDQWVEKFSDERFKSNFIRSCIDLKFLV